MKVFFKKFLPLIITSFILVAAVVGNIIITGIDIDNLPEIDYDDVPETQTAKDKADTAQKNFDTINSKATAAQAEYDKTNTSVSELENSKSELMNSINELKSSQSDLAMLSERYEKCVAETKRLSEQWSVYSDMKIGHIDANYDANNLRANQNNLNIYSAAGDFTGFWGKLLSDCVNQSTYTGFDNLILAVNAITTTANEHLFKADNLLSKINTKINSADTLITEELKGDRLLFEMDLFESAYFGNDDLFEEERKELVHELSYSKAVLDAVYPVYEMLLSDSHNNEQFLIRLYNKSYDIGNYLDSIAKSPDELLTAEEIGVITKDAYQLFPMICDVLTEPTFLYKGIRKIGPERESLGFMAGYESVYTGLKNESYKFMITRYGFEATKPRIAFYYSPEGKPIYAVYDSDIVCLVDDTVVYTSNESETDWILEVAARYYKDY